MSLVGLETELHRVKEDLGKVKKVNSDFEHVLSEMRVLKEMASASVQERISITEELKNKEILDLFASIEQDFDDLKTQLSKQSIERSKVADFVESMRTKKTFSFEETGKAIVFLESVVDALKSTHVTIRPEFVGMVDLGEPAIRLGLHKSSSSVIIEAERLSSALEFLFNRKLLRNLIFETDNAKISFKATNNITMESDNFNIRKAARLAKQSAE